MKLFTSFASILAMATAGQIYSQPQAEHYAHAADVYQSAVEYQQQGYSDQSQTFAGHEAAYQKPSAEKTAKILAYHSENDGHNYHYGFETDNGIKAEEVGQVSKGTKVEGAYSYTGDDGHTYTVTYTADEHGFRAQGAHLPTPPPIPEAILKSLEQNAKDEASGIFDDGHYHEQHQEAGHYHQQNQEAGHYLQQNQEAGHYLQQNQEAGHYLQQNQEAGHYNQQHQAGQNYQYESYHNAPQVIASADVGYHH